MKSFLWALVLLPALVSAQNTELHMMVWVIPPAGGLTTTILTSFATTAGSVLGTFSPQFSALRCSSFVDKDNATLAVADCLFVQVTPALANSAWKVITPQLASLTPQYGPTVGIALQSTFVRWAAVLLNTWSPTTLPTKQPTLVPTPPTPAGQTDRPTKMPSNVPTKSPTLPTRFPTKAPSRQPTKSPTTSSPTRAPETKKTTNGAAGVSFKFTALSLLLASAFAL